MKNSGTFRNFLEPSRTFCNFLKFVERSRTFWNILENSGTSRNCRNNILQHSEAFSVLSYKKMCYQEIDRFHLTAHIFATSSRIIDGRPRAINQHNCEWVAVCGCGEKCARTQTWVLSIILILIIQNMLKSIFEHFYQLDESRVIV